MAVGTFLIAPDDPRRDDIRALLEAHLAFANEVTPAEHVNALGLTGLLEPGITFFSLRVDGELLGIGALKELDPGHGELKSMHTTKAARRGGVGRAMVAHLVATARDRGYGRISLETGTMEAFAPARALYAACGFEPCGPFGDYEETPSNTFMTMVLPPARGC